MKSRGEAISHFNGVRPRVIGEGSLLVAAYAPGGDNTDILIETVMPYTMAASTEKQPTLLMNVKQQRISLEIKVTEINEWFQINRMNVFYRQLFTSFPGRG
jgi:hypothetical protein